MDIESKKRYCRFWIVSHSFHILEIVNLFAFNDSLVLSCIQWKLSQKLCNGKDDYIEQILCNYLIPLTVILLQSAPTNAKKEQVDSVKQIF